MEGATLAWEELSHTGSNQIYNSADKVIKPGYENHYAVEGEYNLIFKDIEQQHGHAHKCSLVVGGPLSSTKEFVALGEF